MNERSLINIKNKHIKLLKMAYHLEDLTNYDIIALGKAIDILQKIDIDKEFNKHNKEVKKNEE